MMRQIYILLAAMLLPFVMIAQVNEPIKNKEKKSAKQSEEIFVFPDNIRFNKEELNKRVEMKTQELAKALNTLAEVQVADYREEINTALKLFNNDDRKMVTVTGKKYPEPVTKPIRVYLIALAKLHYDKVSIVWHNAQYVSNFIKQPDGTYTALVAFEQEFTGIKEGEVNYTYHDVTRKRAEVTVKMWDEVENGVVTKSYMDVFLGNIGVVEE